MNKEELGALILVAVFICAPLYVGESHWHSNVSKDTGLTDIMGGLTLAVLIFQSWIYHGQKELMNRQTGIMERQNAITHQAYIANYRPKLIIRDVYMDKLKGLSQESNDSYGIHYMLVNNGGSKAKVLEVGFWAHRWRRDFRPFANTIEAPEALSGVFLEAGEAKEETIEIAINKSDLDEIMASFEIERMGGKPLSNYNLVFRGFVIYSDDNGVTRRTSVWRTCNGPPHLRMVASTDTDYEYVD